MFGKGKNRKEASDVLKKVDETVKQETFFIAFSAIILSMLMEAVFLILKKWDYTVLLGNILGGGATVLNFFLLGLTVQKAVTKDEKDAKNLMAFSQKMRLLMLFIVVLIGALVPCFNIFATLIPLLFTRIALIFRPMIGRKNAEPVKSENDGNTEEMTTEWEDEEDE